MPDIIRGGYQPPGTRTRQTDTGTGGYTPPQNNYAQQQQSAQEAARRAELDRLARQNAQQIAAARRQAYQQQMQALQQKQAEAQRQAYEQYVNAQKQAEWMSESETFEKVDNVGYNNPNAGVSNNSWGDIWRFHGPGGLLAYGPAKIARGVTGAINAGEDALIPDESLQNTIDRFRYKGERNSDWGVYDPYGLYGERYGGSFTPYGEGWYKPDLNMFNWNDGRKNEFMEEIWPEPNYAVPETAGYPSSGGYGDYQMPNYGGYGYPSINYNYPEYEEPAKSWYENMLQWNIK